MKNAVCYYSHHHNNTLQVLKAMAQAAPLDLIDVASCQAAHLEHYACIGFASGIYGFEVHKSVVEFARQHLPQGTPVFFVYTYGVSRGVGARALEAVAQEKGCPVLGEFGCRGYDTFGPLRLIGGIAKGHPDQFDLERARAFYQKISTHSAGPA